MSGSNASNGKLKEISSREKTRQVVAAVIEKIEEDYGGLIDAKQLKRAKRLVQHDTLAAKLLLGLFQVAR